MNIVSIRKARASRLFLLLGLFSFLAAPAGPSRALSQTPTAEETIYSAFEEVIRLRTDGEYDRAIAALSEIIAAHAQSEEIVRLAYNHLVFTYMAKEDLTGARDRAREALEKYPDLTASLLTFPPRLNDTYDQLRREMFGSLVITRPAECQVFLDEKFIGETPLEIPLVRVGEHRLSVTRSGHHDYSQQLRIDPERTLDLSGLSLDRTRGKKWWLTRVGAGVVGVVLLAVGLASGGDETAPEPDKPLDPPPPPPAGK